MEHKSGGYSISKWWTRYSYQRNFMGTRRFGKKRIILLHIDLRPSRQSRNRCIRSKISRNNLDRWRVEFGAITTPKGSRWTTKQLYNQVPQTVRGSWSQFVGVVRVAVSRQWEPARDRRLGPWGPRLSSTAEWGGKCCYDQRNLGSICCSLFRLQLTSYTQSFRNPFANNLWEVYFF